MSKVEENTFLQTVPRGLLRLGGRMPSLGDLHGKKWIIDVVIGEHDDEVKDADKKLLITEHMDHIASQFGSFFPNWHYRAMEHQLEKGTVHDRVYFFVRNYRTQVLTSACVVKFSDAYINDGQPRPTRVAIIKNIWTHADHPMDQIRKSLLKYVGQWLDMQDIKFSIFFSPATAPIFSDLG